MTGQADSAAHPQQDRVRRRRWLVWVLVLVLPAAGLLAWTYRHPDVAFENGYGMAMTRDVGFTVWTTLGDSDQPGDSLTFSSLEPLLRQDGAAVRVEYVVCELDPVALEADRVSGFGYGLPTRAMERYCRATRPAEGAELSMRAGVRQELLVGITATKPGRTVISGHRVTYRVGWQRGSSDIAVTTRLTARPEGAGSTRSDEVATVVYLISPQRHGNRGNPPLPSGQGVTAVTLPGTAVPAAELPGDAERISAAVDALLRQRAQGRRDTLWAPDCAPGRSVAGVRVTRELVTVRLQGDPARGCPLNQATAWLQSQQLAWTVLANSDLPPDVAIRLVDGYGRPYERVAADPAMVVDRQPR